MLDTFLKQFPLLIRSTIQFYFFPRKFIDNFRTSKPQSVLTYFAAISSVIFLLSFAYSLAFNKPLFTIPSENFSIESLMLNGNEYRIDQPFIKEVGIFGIHGNTSIGLGATISQYISIPFFLNEDQICVSVSLEASSMLEIKIPDEIEIELLSEDGSIELTEKLLSHSVSRDQLVELDRALRHLMTKICKKNFMYATGAPGYFLAGTSPDNNHLLDSNELNWTFPWSEPNVYLSKGSIILNFGLVNTEIAGVSPKDIGGKVYVIFLTTFMLAAGYSLVVSFQGRDFLHIKTIRQSFQIALAIFIFPYLIFWIFSVFKTASGRNWIVLEYEIAIVNVTPIILLLRYLMLSPSQGLSKLKAVWRLLISAVLFLVICCLFLAPLNTFLLLRYAQFS